MKIKNTPKPYFRLEIPRDTVRLLKQMAMCHYDTRCKATAMSADKSPYKVNGTLIIWEMFCADDDVAPSFFTGGAGPDELDTLSKVCELRGMMPFNPTEGAAVDDFVRSVRAAMRDAGVWS